jgi:WhiB family redox-sensing transcriptional regulator
LTNSEFFKDEFTRLVAETSPECTEANPDYWFADEHDEDEKYGKSEQAIAAGICKRCPIKHPCLQYALTTNQTHGIWGGLLPAQRHSYLNQMNRSEGRL